MRVRWNLRAPRTRRPSVRDAPGGDAMNRNFLDKTPFVNGAAAGATLAITCVDEPYFLYTLSVLAML